MRILDHETDSADEDSNDETESDDETQFDINDEKIFKKYFNNNNNNYNKPKSVC